MIVIQYWKFSLSGCGKPNYFTICRMRLKKDLILFLHLEFMLCGLRIAIHLRVDLSTWWYWEWADESGRRLMAHAIGDSNWVGNWIGRILWKENFCKVKSWPSQQGFALRQLPPVRTECDTYSLRILFRIRRPQISYIMQYSVVHLIGILIH